MNDHLKSFSPCEYQAILVHKYFLGIQWHKDPTLSEAIDDWKKHYANEWQSRIHRKATKRQLAEIQRYQFAHQLDFKVAAKEWIAKYAEQWRIWWEKNGCKECDGLDEDDAYRPDNNSRWQDL